MKKQITLYITRHGQTEHNIQQRAQGWSDSPLTDGGREIAARLGRGLREITFSYVFSSPAKRAVDTARILLDNMNVDLPIYIEDNLKERGLGKLEGRVLGNIAFIKARESATVAGFEGKMDLDLFDYIYENMKPQDDEPHIETPYGIGRMGVVKARLKKALDDICGKIDEPEANVLIVTHGLAIAAMLYAITGERYSDGIVGNASVTLIEYVDGVYRIGEVDDMSYIG